MSEPVRAPTLRANAPLFVPRTLSGRALGGDRADPIVAEADNRDARRGSGRGRGGRRRGLPRGRSMYVRRDKNGGGGSGAGGGALKRGASFIGRYTGGGPGPKGNWRKAGGKSDLDERHPVDERRTADEKHTANERHPTDERHPVDERHKGAGHRGRRSIYGNGNGADSRSFRGAGSWKNGTRKEQVQRKREPEKCDRHKVWDDSRVASDNVGAQEVMLGEVTPESGTITSPTLRRPLSPPKEEVMANGDSHSREVVTNVDAAEESPDQEVLDAHSAFLIMSGLDHAASSVMASFQSPSPSFTHPTSTSMSSAEKSQENINMKIDAVEQSKPLSNARSEPSEDVVAEKPEDIVIKRVDDVVERSKSPSNTLLESSEYVPAEKAEDHVVKRVDDVVERSKSPSSTLSESSECMPAEKAEDHVVKRVDDVFERSNPSSCTRSHPLEDVSESNTSPVQTDSEPEKEERLIQPDESHQNLSTNSNATEPEKATAAGDTLRSLPKVDVSDKLSEVSLAEDQISPSVQRKVKNDNEDVRSKTFFSTTEPKQSRSLPTTNGGEMPSSGRWCQSCAGLGLQIAALIAENKRIRLAESEHGTSTSPTTSKKGWKFPDAFKSKVLGGDSKASSERARLRQEVQVLRATVDFLYRKLDEKDNA